MRCGSRFITFALICLLLGTPSAFAQRTLATQGAANDRMVVVISLDGFPASSLDDPKLPVPTFAPFGAGGARAEGDEAVSNPSVHLAQPHDDGHGCPAASTVVLFNACC